MTLSLFPSRLYPSKVSKVRAPLYGRPTCSCAEFRRAGDCLHVLNYNLALAGLPHAPFAKGR